MTKCAPSSFMLVLLLVAESSPAANISDSIALEQRQHFIDSITCLIEARSGIEKWEPWYELAFYHIGNGDMTSALMAVSESLTIASSHRDSLKYCKSSRVKAQLLGKLHRTEEQISILTNLFPVARRNNFHGEYITSLNSLGNAFIHLGQYDAALYYHFLSLDARKTHGSTTDIALALSNIGLIYYKLEDYDRALLFYEECKNMYEQLGDEGCDGMALALLNASLCHVNKNDATCAEESLYLAVSVGTPAFTLSHKVDIIFNHARILFSVGKLKQAKSLFRASYELAKKQNDVRFQLDNAVFLARILFKENKEADAYAILSEADVAVRALTFRPGRLTILKQLGDILMKEKDYRNASTYFQKYIALQDSVYNFKFVSRAMRVESQHVEKEGAYKIQLEKEVVRLKEAQIQQQQTIIAATVALALALLILSVVLLHSYGRKRYMNRLLEEKVAERTTDLERTQSRLLNMLVLKDMVFHKTLAEVSSRIAAIEGLSSILGRYGADPKDVENLIRVQDCTKDLLAYVRKKIPRL